MVKKILILVLPFLLLLVFYFSLKDSKTPMSSESKIVVYTYSSFASSWGAGVELQSQFLAATGLVVEFVDIGEAGVILQRLKLEGERSSADVVLGLDQFSLATATKEQSWKSVRVPSVSWDLDFPSSDRIQNGFIAYNWAPMTFIYRSGEVVPLKSLKELIQVKYNKSLSLLDPRTSSPGYIFFHWLVQKLGVTGVQDFFRSIKNNIVTVSPSWSAGYGLFTKNQAKLVFSYVTSPAYHWIEEKNKKYQPMYLEDALPYHVEYVGILESCKNCEGAQKFVDFLLSPLAQKIILQKNYMYPVIAGQKEGTPFEGLKPVKLFQPVHEISRSQIIEVWKSLQI